MEPWQEEIKQIEEEIKQLNYKLEGRPHLTKSKEHDYDIKSEIIKLQNRIIAIYVHESEKMLKKMPNHKGN